MFVMDTIEGIAFAEIVAISEDTVLPEEVVSSALLDVDVCLTVPALSLSFVPKTLSPITFTV